MPSKKEDIQVTGTFTRDDFKAIGSWIKDVVILAAIGLYGTGVLTPPIAKQDKKAVERKIDESIERSTPEYVKEVARRNMITVEETQKILRAHKRESNARLDFISEVLVNIKKEIERHNDSKVGKK